MEAIAQLKEFIKHNFNVHNFNKFMIQNDYSSLDDLIKQCKVDETGQRFNLWRLFFKIYTSEDEVFQKVEKLQKHREIYRQLEQKHLKQAEQTQVKQEVKQVSGPLGGGGPLGVAKSKQSNQSSTQIDNAELKNEIRKDVERTYQETQFFATKKVVSILTNILFIWSKENSEISYRQGMNEVAAHIIYVYFREALYKDEIDKIAGASETDKEVLMQFNSCEYAEADIYSVFQKLMNEAQHMEMFRPNYTEAQKIKLQSKKPSAILTRVAKIQDILLKQADLNLFRHLKLLQVEFQIFLLKWIRCMFTRELHFIESLTAWDAIFYEYHQTNTDTLFAVDCIAIAMIIYVKNQLLENEDSSQCYQRFLKYPPVSNLPGLIEASQVVKAVLLNQKPVEEIEVAQTFQQSQQSSSYAEKTFNPVFFAAPTDKLDTKDKESKVQVLAYEKPQYKMKGDIDLDYKDEDKVKQQQQYKQQIQIQPQQQQQQQQQTNDRVFKSQFSVDDSNNTQNTTTQVNKPVNQQVNMVFTQTQVEEMVITLQEAINLIKSVRNDSEVVIDTMSNLSEMKDYFSNSLKDPNANGKSQGVTESKISVTQGGFIIKKSSDQGSSNSQQESSFSGKVTSFLKKTKW